VNYYDGKIYYRVEVIEKPKPTSSPACSAA